MNTPCHVFCLRLYNCGIPFHNQERKSLRPKSRTKAAMTPWYHLASQNIMILRARFPVTWDNPEYAYFLFSVSAHRGTSPDRFTRQLSAADCRSLRELKSGYFSCSSHFFKYSEYFINITQFTVLGKPF